MPVASLSSKLYPPILAGTLPSFYTTQEGTTLVVPFSMNKTVSAYDVQEFAIKIKTSTTDKEIRTWYSNNWNKNEVTDLKVTCFIDNAETLFTVGQFYKVQLAYVNTSGITGYYSTVGIIKYTAEPRVTLGNLTLDAINDNISEFIGVYENNDVSEKAHQYKFTLFDDAGAAVATTGWKFHNSYNDTEVTSSTDYYILDYRMNERKTYKIQYSVLTNNSLEINSAKYLVQETSSIATESLLSLKLEVDTDNGGVKIGLNGSFDEDLGELTVTGAFVITRSSSNDDYSSWLKVLDFRLIDSHPSDFAFEDFTVEQGVSYQYALQQYNDNKLFSEKTLSRIVEVDFEDMFLFDGQRQLKIRFNPKVTSFKTVVSETKKNTLGGKYPFFFRNANNYYHEFPISGLLSYLEDNDELFMNKKQYGYGKWEDTTDLISKNMTLERYFKLEVLEWLNNGKVKLFRSPAEGNYIVRITNTSLTPNDSLGRMLHTFSCTADEVSDYSLENLEKYDIVITQPQTVEVMRWSTIVLADLYQKEYAKAKKAFDLLTPERKTELLAGELDENGHRKDPIVLPDTSLDEPERTDKQIQEIVRLAVLNQVALDNYVPFTSPERDLLNGYNCYYLRLDNLPPGIIINYQDSGSNGAYKEILMGANGYYEASFDGGIQNIYLSQLTEYGNSIANLDSKSNLFTDGMQGQITYGIKSTAQNRFDTIASTYLYDLPGIHVSGPNDDILDSLQDYKNQLSKIYYIKFTKRPTQEIYGSINPQQELHFRQILQLAYARMMQEPKEYTIFYVANVAGVSNDNAHLYVVNDWYMFNGINLVPLGKGEAGRKNFYNYIGTDNPGTLHIVNLTEQKDLVNEAITYQAGVWTKYNNDTVYKWIAADGTIKYYIYTKQGDQEIMTEVAAKDYTADILIDGNIPLSVEDTLEYNANNWQGQPKSIKIGGAVMADFGVQMRHINYGCEYDESLSLELENFNTAQQNYYAALLGMYPTTEKGLTEDDLDNEAILLYYFENQRFKPVSNIAEKKALFNNQQVLTYYYYNTLRPLNATNQALVDQGEEKIVRLKQLYDEAYRLYMLDVLPTKIKESEEIIA